MTSTLRSVRTGGATIAYWHEKASLPNGKSLLCVHGWPETKRIYLRVVAPLADAGFDVIVPDLRGFGDSSLADDGMYDIVSHASDMESLVFDHLGLESVITIGGDLGGPVIQELALRNPDRVERMVLFNSPLPFDADRMSGMRTRAAEETMDYFIRQGTDADALIEELATPSLRRDYISEFYSTRLWAHPGTFTPDDITWHVEPFLDASKLRASFTNYESAFDRTKRVARPLFSRNTVTPTLILFGVSDHVIYPDFDQMAATVFERHSGPVRIENCGHFVPWESPAVFVDNVVGYCR